MDRIAHLALRTPDVAKTARFYETFFGLEETQRKYEPGAGDNPPDEMIRRLYLSDGYMNLTICKVPVVGMYHFGFVVDSVDETLARLVETGATQGDPGRPSSAAKYHEVSIKGPDGIGIDLSETGWPEHTPEEVKDKIQHIALATSDVVKTASFYKQVFGLKEVHCTHDLRPDYTPPPGEVGGILLSDGSMNLTLRETASVGMHHFGFKLENIDQTIARLEAGNVPLVSGRGRGNVSSTGQDQPYGARVKYRGPDDITLDLSEQGWRH